MQVDERTAAAIARLTENERECLRRRLLPQTAKEMALDLGISPHAVEKRLKMARAKLGLSSSLEAARLLAAAEGDQPLGPQPPDLAGGDGTGQDGAVAVPPRARRLIVPLAIGVLLVTLLTLLLLATAPQSAPPAPQPTPASSQPATPPGGVPIEHIVFRPASPDETRAFVRDSFRTMDKDGSGFIERGEAPESGIINSPNGAPGEQVPINASITTIHGRTGRAMWIALFDNDADGRVSEAEYVSYQLPIFLKEGVPVNWRGVEAANAGSAARR